MPVRDKKKVRELMDTEERRVGAPKLLTEEIIKEFKRLLPITLFLESIAASLGIDRSTWANWLKRGRKEHKRIQNNPAAKVKAREKLYIKFFRVYLRGIGKGEVQLLQALKKHRMKNWQVITWQLERRWQERWGPEKAELRKLQKQVDELSQMLKERE